MRGGLFQLNNVSDGFRYVRRFELFFESGVIGFEELSDQVSDSGDKGEGAFEQEGNGGHRSPAQTCLLFYRQDYESVHKVPPNQ